MNAEFDEVELHRRLSTMPFWKQLVFLLVVSQRLLPSFRAFSKESNYSGENVLSDLLKKAWSTLLQGTWQADYSSEVIAAESVAPDTEDFDSLFVSSALDAAIATSLLMQAFMDGKTETVVEGVTLARDSIDMYVQELEDIDPNELGSETKILNHDLMQKELDRQDEDLQFLKDLDDEISVSIKLAKKKWFGSGDSCLGLTDKDL